MRNSQCAQHSPAPVLTGNTARGTTNDTKWGSKQTAQNFRTAPLIHFRLDYQCSQNITREKRGSFNSVKYTQTETCGEGQNNTNPPRTPTLSCSLTLKKSGAITSQPFTQGKQTKAPVLLSPEPCKTTHVNANIRTMKLGIVITMLNTHAGRCKQLCQPRTTALRLVVIQKPNTTEICEVRKWGERGGE